MSMQSMTGAPARNASVNAAAKPGKVSVGAGHASTVKASTAPTSNAPTPGSGVKGFSGTAIKPGKVKV